MTRILTLLIFLFLSPFLWAQDQTNENEPKTSDSASQKETQKNQDQGEPAIWPKSFQPSQEIGADSQISFPTDI